MITFHVAIIIRSRDVWRIHINQIHMMFRTGKNIALLRNISNPVRKNCRIVCGNLFNKMLFKRKPKVAPAIIVLFSDAGYGKHTSRLPFNAGS